MTETANSELLAPIAADPRVQHIVMDSGTLPQKEAIALWQESLGVFYDVRLRNKADRFSFRADAYHLGEILLTGYSCVAQSFDRTRARIGRDGLDHITLQVCLRGSHGRRDGGAADQANAGDLIIADLAQAQATATTDHDSLSLTIPRRLLAPLLKTPDEHNLRRIPGNAPLAALLRNHLTGLYAGAGAMTADEAEAIVRPTIELAAAALNASISEESAASVQLVLTRQISRHIDQHVLDPALSGESIAAAFGISTRKLYYLFEAHGGVAAYVTRGRLQLARAMLADPTQQGRSIADVAELHGFAYRTNFVRAFRREFGVTPREVRAHAAEGRRLFERPGDDTTMWHWVRQLK
ncbi:transcriptional regulator, AraC family [Ancylobacter novellus DSM 506]|uniref:Transcriptional regulator, AraC family n=2 Tax=Ancylobacter novellus TaxID=921 RepID=D7A0T6_ANCN5|nr:transcriptional regulator, AraC family [Ancylobacter novellus DSM 506]